MDDGEGHVLDLSALIKSDGHHLAISDVNNKEAINEAYYINVCRPLNPIDSILCSPLAAACAVKSDGKPVVCIVKSILILHCATWYNLKHLLIHVYTKPDKFPSKIAIIALPCPDSATLPGHFDFLVWQGDQSVWAIM